jgi:hypothetical protein
MMVVPPVFMTWMTTIGAADEGASDVAEPLRNHLIRSSPATRHNREARRDTSSRALWTVSIPR